MEIIRKLQETEGVEFKINCNRRGQDDTTVFLYDVENYFVVGANDLTLDRDRIH